MTIRLILNGKKASLENVRSAINATRTRHNAEIQVRVTYEYGDIERFVHEAITDKVSRLVIGGGDGSVNEIVSALMQHPKDSRPELAILPLGTANDFATCCHIPQCPNAALQLATDGMAYKIDVGTANERYFVNVASGGFGAQVTSETPVELKNFLGGGAYTLTGLVRALNFKPYQGILTTEQGFFDTSMIVGAVCNGRQAGGGQVLAPSAFIDDGLLDVVALLAFPVTRINQVIQELGNPNENNEFVKYVQTKWVEYESQLDGQVNLDGEPYKSKKIRFDILRKEISLVLPNSSPCITRTV
ncbi:lipid kinase YegS [Pseudoalteromonas sp. GB56]